MLDGVGRVAVDIYKGGRVYLQTVGVVRSPFCQQHVSAGEERHLLPQTGDAVEERIHLHLQVYGSRVAKGEWCFHLEHHVPVGIHRLFAQHLHLDVLYRIDRVVGFSLLLSLLLLLLPLLQLFESHLFSSFKRHLGDGCQGVCLQHQHAGGVGGVVGECHFQ